MLALCVQLVLFQTSPEQHSSFKVCLLVSWKAHKNKDCFLQYFIPFMSTNLLFHSAHGAQLSKMHI